MKTVSPRGPERAPSTRVRTARLHHQHCSVGGWPPPASSSPYILFQPPWPLSRIFPVETLWYSFACLFFTWAVFLRFCFLCWSPVTMSLQASLLIKPQFPHQSHIDNDLCYWALKDIIYVEALGERFIFSSVHFYWIPIVCQALSSMPAETRFLFYD